MLDYIISIMGGVKHAEGSERFSGNAQKSDADTTIP